MAFLDKLRGADFTGLNRAFGRNKRGHGEIDDNRGISGGLPSRRAKAVIEDENNKTTLILRGVQSFFLLIALFINIALAVFQSTNKVGVSGLVGLTFFVLIVALLLTLSLLIMQALHQRNGTFKGAMRVVRQVRFASISAGALVLLLVVIALVCSISASVKGCKDAAQDPHSDDKDYLTKLPGFCRNRSALAAFLWFSAVAWMASLFFALKQWRNIRKEGGSIPGFKPPGGHEQGYSSATAFDDGDPAFDPPEDDEVYDRRPAMAYAASRPSGTFISGDRAPFGALAPGLPSRSEPRTDDPLPTGYAPASQRQSNPFADTHAPSTPPAYVDPYERIRANYQLDESSPPRLAPLPYAGGGLSDPIR